MARSTFFVASLLSTLSFTTAAPFSYISAAAVTPGQLAGQLTATLPNKAQGLLASPFWWWESGTTIDALMNYAHINGDTQYNTMISDTLLSQATGTNDFMVSGQATGNDDQSWWALAAMSAAEYGLPVPAGSPSWVSLAQNVFNDQKGRWQTATCSGGLKWKINAGDTGYTYRSTISNALFFQLAARLARFNADADAQSWAEKSWAWMTTTGGGGGVVTSSFDVFDGTDDSNGCSDVNHDLWSYNTGAMLYGSAIMATIDAATWTPRAQGFVDAVNRNFVSNGNLFETKCEGSNTCNTDQEAFKGITARWLGASAVVLPSLQDSVGTILAGSETSATDGWQSKDAMGVFTALEIVDALKAAGSGSAVAPSVAYYEAVDKRSLAQRMWVA